jgi:Mn-containing catalase
MERAKTQRHMFYLKFLLLRSYLHKLMFAKNIQIVLKENNPTLCQNFDRRETYESIGPRFGDPFINGFSPKSTTTRLPYNLQI